MLKMLGMSQYLTARDAHNTGYSSVLHCKYTSPVPVLHRGMYYYDYLRLFAYSYRHIIQYTASTSSTSEHVMLETLATPQYLTQYASPNVLYCR